MKYIVHTKFKSKAICGDVNLPAMTACECNGTVITHEGRPISFVKSENAHQYFAIDEDGMGMVRGRLTQDIQKTLAKRDDEHQSRWDKVWEDEICRSFKRDDYDDYWLWNHEFFNADVETLRYIAKLVGAKEET